MEDIPVSCVEHIVKFLGPVECAKLGSTCNTMRHLIYTRSVWKRFIWVPKYTEAFYKIPPVGTTHFGSCHPLCFYTWLKYAINNDAPIIPLALLQTTDNDAFVKGAYKYWLRIQQPCVIPIHHNVWDLCKFRATLLNSNAIEQAEVFHHIVMAPAKMANYYSTFLTVSLEQARAFVSTHPVLLDRVGIESVTKRYMDAVVSRRSYVNEQLGRVIAKYKQCSEKIRALGNHPFEINKLRAYYGEY